MKARLNLFAYALILSAFIVTSIAAGADEARIKVAMTETSQQPAGAASVQQHPPRDLQMAQQQCRSGRNDCLTRPQQQCGPGLNDCLSLGQTNCRDAAAAPYRPGVNTAGIDNALKNPNLPPEQRASLLATKERIEKARSHAGNFQYNKCLIDVGTQCRVTHC